MFCPKCGAKNADEQSYCRGCGHGLVSHRLAMEGKVEDAGTHIKSGSMLISIALIIIGIVKLNLILNLIFRPSKFGIIFNILLLLAAALPLMIAGVLRLARARRSLSPPREGGAEAITANEAMPLAAAPTTDHLIAVPSVTEHTTLELKEPEQRR
ncbi:MAG TPA: zinc ribbon domain-containing protein [Blastocatellia bacterium]|nr:zinc ribbon domain-containing protein [Blastocatellia bacterium]